MEGNLIIKFDDLLSLSPISTFKKLHEMVWRKTKF